MVDARLLDRQPPNGPDRGRSVGRKADVLHQLDEARVGTEAVPRWRSAGKSSRPSAPRRRSQPRDRLVQVTQAHLDEGERNRVDLLSGRRSLQLAEYLPRLVGPPRQAQDPAAKAFQEVEVPSPRLPHRQTLRAPLRNGPWARRSSQAEVWLGGLRAHFERPLELRDGRVAPSRVVVYPADLCGNCTESGSSSCARCSSTSASSYRPRIWRQYLVTVSARHARSSG